MPVKAELREAGYTILGGLISQVQIDKLLNETYVLDPEAKFRSPRAAAQYAARNKTIREALESGCPKCPVPLTHRSKGRLDLQLPKHVANLLEGVHPNVLKKISKALNKGLPASKQKTIEQQIRTHNVMLTQPGAVTQKWHTDDDARHKPGSYFTIIVSLTKSNNKKGTTELFPGTHIDPDDDADEKAVRASLAPGDVLVFDGLIKHRGTANRSSKNRFIYYVVMSNHRDRNVWPED